MTESISNTRGYFVGAIEEFDNNVFAIQLVPLDGHGRDSLRLCGGHGLEAGDKVYVTIERVETRREERTA
jgi:hypothetical protein